MSEYKTHYPISPQLALAYVESKNDPNIKFNFMLHTSDKQVLPFKTLFQLASYIECDLNIELIDKTFKVYLYQTNGECLPLTTEELITLVNEEYEAEDDEHDEKEEEEDDEDKYRDEDNYTRYKYY